MTKELIEEARNGLLSERIAELEEKHEPILAWTGGAVPEPSHEVCSSCGDGECSFWSELQAILAARQPTEDDREAVANLLNEVHDPCVTEGGCNFSGWTSGYMTGSEVSDVVDELIARWPRASVPDAATGRIAELEATIRLDTEGTRHLYDDLKRAEAERDAARAEIESRIEDRDYWYGVAATAKDQRDAALAAVERVRAIHAPDSVVNDACSECSDFGTDEHPVWLSVPWPCPTVAALDGAPEPEWEERTSYGVEMEGEQIVLDPWGRNYVPHQRTARFGPWLP